MSQILRAFSATVDDVNTKDRTIVSKVTVGDIDRHRTLILSRGVELDSYRKNPVVLFEHGKDPTRGMLPVGRCVWIKHDEVGNGRILAKTAFASDDFSSLLLDFYEQGVMRGWSIRAGFKDASPPSREEIRRRPELAECDTVYRSTVLYEYSAVSIPSCPTALSDPELRSLSTLVVRGFWTPTEEVKPLIEPIIERMTESGGMASGGALVADDDASEGGEPDGDDDDAEGVAKKKKKKAEERSADDESGDDGSIAMCAEKPEMRSAGDAETVADEVEPEADVTRAGPPDEPRNRIGEWTDGEEGKSEESKANRRKSRPSKYDSEGNRKSKPTEKDVAKLDKLQAKYDKSPLYKTPDLKDEKTGETFSFKVVKNAGYHEDPGEHKYYAKTVGSKEGDIDNDGYNNPQKAAKAVDASYKRMAKELDKAAGKKRSAPDDEMATVDDDDLIGEWFDYLDEVILDRAAPEPEAVETKPAPEPTPEPVDPLAGLPPLVGRSLEDISRMSAAKVAAWEKSVKTMFDELEGYIHGKA